MHRIGDRKKTFTLATWLVFLLSACGSSALLAGPDKHCNGDAPLRRCSGNDEFNAYGVHVLDSGANACAAIRWTSGWPVEGSSTDGDSGPETLADIEHHADIVTPDGVPIPERGIHQPTTEIEACWVLKAISDKHERPMKTSDARKPFELTCTDNPPNLKYTLPALTAIGRLTVDPRARQMNFFGIPLGLVPHAGSAYLGTEKEFAVTLHKRTGIYTVVLPNGFSLAGSCQMPSKR